MKCNVSRTDKIVRTILSVALVAIGLYLQPTAGAVALIVPIVIALVLLSTVFLSWCPIYAVLGISTCKTAA
jgi:cell division protein FtsW (lipid II flippase)